MIILAIMKVSRLVNFRLAKKYDIDKICEIVKENVILMNKNGNFQWSEKYPLYEDFYGDYLKNSFYVLENNEILGFLTLDFNKPEEYKDILWKNEKKSIYLHRMAVSKIYHKKGTGFKLLKYAYDISKQLNVENIRTDTSEKNFKMKNLLLKFGFSEAGKFIFKEIDFVCYEKIIGGKDDF